MRMWVARDEDGTISLYYDKPIKETEFCGCELSKGRFYGDSVCLNNDDFPEVTYENSPQEVEVKLIR